MLIYNDNLSRVDVSPQGCGVFRIHFSHSYGSGKRVFTKHRRVDRKMLEGILHSLDTVLSETASS